MRKAASALTFINRSHFQSPRIIDSALLRQKEDKSSQNEEFMRLSYPAQFVISWDGSFFKAVAIIHWKSLTSRWAAELFERKADFFDARALFNSELMTLCVAAVLFCSATDQRRKDCKRMMVGVCASDITLKSFWSQFNEEDENMNQCLWPGDVITTRNPLPNHITLRKHCSFLWQLQKKPLNVSIILLALDYSALSLSISRLMSLTMSPLPKIYGEKAKEEVINWRSTERRRFPGTDSGVAPEKSCCHWFWSASLHSQHAQRGEKSRGSLSGKGREPAKLSESKSCQVEDVLWRVVIRSN